RALPDADPDRRDLADVLHRDRVRNLGALAHFLKMRGAVPASALWKRCAERGTQTPRTSYWSERTIAMSLLKWALIMLVVSIVAALFGFTGLSAASADVARILFYSFVVIFLVLLIAGLMGARAGRGP